MDERVPDKDWISRRFQGEGTVVRREPALRAGEAPVKAGRDGGDAQFGEGLGQHCGLCERLDFLPLACVFCTLAYCPDCIDVDAHACTAKHSKQPRRIIDESAGRPRRPGGPGEHRAAQRQGGGGQRGVAQARQVRARSVRPADEQRDGAGRQTEEHAAPAVGRGAAA